MTEPFTEIIQPYYHLANTVNPSMTSLKNTLNNLKTHATRRRNYIWKQWTLKLHQKSRHRVYSPKQ